MHIARGAEGGIPPRCPKIHFLTKIVKNFFIFFCPEACWAYNGHSWVRSAPNTAPKDKFQATPML